MSQGSKIYCQQGKKSLFCTNLAQTSNRDQFVLSAEASVMRDIDHISVSVGPPVTRDYRIDRIGTVPVVSRFDSLVSHLFKV